MLDLIQIVENCKNNNRESQKVLFDTYSPVMNSICVRYVNNNEEAGDILQEGFIKILSKINDYSGTGSFEGWMKKIMVNTAISYYHKNKKYNFHQDITEVIDISSSEPVYGESDFTIEELESVIKDLPEGYRVVFNLFAIEGFKHKEIAEMLNIDENTSKSQYSRARKNLRQKLELLSQIKKKKELFEHT